MRKSEKIERAERILKGTRQSIPQNSKIHSGWKDSLMLAVHRENLKCCRDKQEAEDLLFWRLAWCSVVFALLLSISFLLYQNHSMPATYNDQTLLREIDNAAVVDVSVFVNQTENGI